MPHSTDLRTRRLLPRSDSIDSHALYRRTASAGCSAQVAMSDGNTHYADRPRRFLTVEPNVRRRCRRGAASGGLRTRMRPVPGEARQLAHFGEILCGKSGRARPKSDGGDPRRMTPRGGSWRGGLVRWPRRDPRRPSGPHCRSANLYSVHILCVAARQLLQFTLRPICRRYGLIVIRTPATPASTK